MKMSEVPSFTCNYRAWTRQSFRDCVVCDELRAIITWQKRNNPLFGVLLSTVNWKFVEDSHL